MSYLLHTVQLRSDNPFVRSLQPPLLIITEYLIKNIYQIPLMDFLLCDMGKTPPPPPQRQCFLRRGHQFASLANQIGSG